MEGKKKKEKKKKDQLHKVKWLGNKAEHIKENPHIYMFDMKGVRCSQNAQIHEVLQHIHNTIHDAPC